VEIVVIGLIRILGALPVLRWALVGGVLALLVDLSDLLWMNLLHLGGLGDYQRFDKIADLAYFATFAWVAQRWAQPQRRIALALLAFRLLGFLLFEITRERAVLLAFPNLFEFWFLFVASLPHWRPGFRFTRPHLLIAGGILLALKMGQEVALHGVRALDDFTFVDALDAIWDALTAPVT